MVTPLLAFRDPSSLTKSDWKAFLFAFLVAGGWWGYKLWRERDAQSWPMVQGKVEWTQVRVENTGRHENEIPEVCYSYVVNGEYYSGSHEISQIDFDKYPNGSPVLVHYKSSDPSVSFLDLRDMRAHEESEEPIG